MRKIWWILLVASTLLATCLFLLVGNLGGRKVNIRDGGATLKIPHTESYKHRGREQNSSKVEEDPDLFSFIETLGMQSLDESIVLEKLRSKLSTNKKSVILETYWEAKGPYTLEEWGPLLLKLLLESNDWPDLANKAADHLAVVNASGQLDEMILAALTRLNDGDEIKRVALAYALGTRESIEKALSRARFENEIAVLAEKHAVFLSQDERLQSFLSRAKPEGRVPYLKKFIVEARTREEFVLGLNKGLQDSKMGVHHQDELIFAAAKASLPGRSQVLFEFWKQLRNQKKPHESLFSGLNLAIQMTAYSEADEHFADQIMLWLLEQKGFDGRQLDDQRLDLALVMANACSDKLVVKTHCDTLLPTVLKLRDKLIEAHLSAYLTPQS